MIVRAIALRFGYVESNTLAWLTFQAQYAPYPTSRKEALQSLAEYLFQKFNPPVEGPRRKCCQASLKKDPDGKFCSKCGLSIKKCFYVQAWYDYVSGLQSSDIDGYGFCSEEGNSPHGWDPSAFAFGIADQQILLVHERADEILLLALLDLHPELKEIVDAPDELPADYVVEDYQELLTKDKEEAEHQEVVSYYSNGGICVKRDGKIVGAVYNTGDRIWFGPDGKKVVKISTHDGIEWQDPEWKGE